MSQVLPKPEVGQLLKTPAELRALPDEALIRESSGGAAEADSDVSGRRIWQCTGNEVPQNSAQINMPALLLWLPKDAE
jgi:hypothetical protein